MPLQSHMKLTRGGGVEQEEAGKLRQTLEQSFTDLLFQVKNSPIW